MKDFGRTALLRFGSFTFTVFFGLLCALYPTALMPYRKWIWILFALSLLASIATLFMPHKSKPADIQPTQNAATVQGGVNVTVSPTFNVPVSQHSAPMELASPAANIPQDSPTHNVLFLGANATRVEFGDNCFFEESNTDQPALIVKFRSEPVAGRRIADFNSVRAHVRYYGPNGVEIHSVEAASWLGEKQRLVNLTLGRLQTVVVAVFAFGKWSSPHVVKHVENFSGLNNEYDELTLSDLPSNVVSAEIILNNWRGESLPPQRVNFDLAASDNPTISLR